MPRFQAPSGEIVEADTAEQAAAIATERAYQRQQAQQRVQNMGALERGAHGALAGAGNLGRNLTAMALPRGLTPAFASEEALRAAAANPILQTRAGKVGAFLGETAAAMPLGGVIGKGLGAAAKLGRVAKTVAPVTAAGASGAIEGAAAAGPDNRLQGAGWGLLAGAGTAAALPAAARFVANPVRSTPEAQRLMKMGVDLTPGQMNPGSMIGGSEEILSLIPLVKNARDASQQQYLRRLMRDAAAPNSTFARIDDELLDKLPIDAVAARMYGSFQPGYGALRKAPPMPEAAEGLGPALANVAESPTISADMAEREAASRFMRNKATLLPTDRPAEFKDLQKVRSELRAARRGSSKEGMRDLYAAGADEITARLAAALGPEDAARLAALDRQYADMAVIRDALMRGRASEGGFTPAQGISALSKSDLAEIVMGGQPSPLARNMATGKRVFENKTPATGARMVAPMLATVGLGTLVPAAAGAIALGASTRAGRKILGGMTKPQQMLMLKAELLRRNPAAMAAIGSGAAAAAPLENY